MYCMHVSHTYTLVTCMCEDVTCMCEDVTCMCEDVTCMCEDVTHIKSDTCIGVGRVDV